jgi:hypothetical protein
MLQGNDNEEIDEEDIPDDEEDELVESNLVNRVFDTYCNDVKNEDFEDKKEPELEEDDGVFFVKLEGMIEELKMWKFD